MDKKVWQKILFFSLFACLILLCFIPFCLCNKQEDIYTNVIEKGIVYHIENDIATVKEVANNRTLKQAVIPKSISYKKKNYAVKGIDPYAFSGCNILENITFLKT